MNPNKRLNFVNQISRHTIIFKVIITAGLLVTLMLPTSKIIKLIDERQSRQNDAQIEVSQKWGENQTIAGPVLTVPVKRVFSDQAGMVKQGVEYAYFLPKSLQIEGMVEPVIRYRGIYKVILYHTRLNIKGEFDLTSLDFNGVKQKNLLLDQAFLSFGCSDMKGISEKLDLKFNQVNVDVIPGGSGDNIFDSGFRALTPIEENPLPLSAKKHVFEMSISVKGSRSLSFLPLGAETILKLQSPWAHPSFSGKFLPQERSIDSTGFTAVWKIFSLNRNFPQQWTGKTYDLSAAAFGVDFISPIDTYQKITRITKYALLFISLTFVTFFILELLYSARVHPVQYLLIGFATCLFYSLLLSISEHVNFELAYLISAICIILMISLYTISLLKQKKLALLIALLLSTIYGFLYIVVQMEDYSLIAGNAGLFLILAAVMYFSRKIQWYPKEKTEMSPSAEIGI